MSTRYKPISEGTLSMQRVLSSPQKTTHLTCSALIKPNFDVLCYACVWKNKIVAKGHSVIDFVWDVPRQQGILICWWCEEALCWCPLKCEWCAWQEDWRGRPLRTFKRGTHKRSWWKKKEGREGKWWKNSRMTKMKVGMCCKEKGHGVPVRNTHVITAGVLKRRRG